jgi:hypothetical protein
MLRLPHKTGHWMHELGGALQAARETYRAYSADGEPDPPPAAAPPDRRPEAHVPAVAKRSREVARRLSGRTRAVLAPREEPDVYLDVPELKVDEIDLELDALRARIALEADVLDLLKLNVGVDAELGRVDLQIKGVEASALLKVRLDNLTVIIDRVMTTIDNNPQLLERLVDRVGGTLDELGAAAASAVGDLGRGAGALAEGAGLAAGELAGNGRHPAS